MSNKFTDFPQFRALSNDKVFYKITDDKHFIEIQIIGSKAQIFETAAEQYPEMLKIQDMINLGFEGYKVISEERFNEVLEKHEIVLD